MRGPKKIRRDGHWLPSGSYGCERLRSLPWRLLLIKVVARVKANLFLFRRLDFLEILVRIFLELSLFLLVADFDLAALVNKRVRLAHFAEFHTAHGAGMERVRFGAVLLVVGSGSAKRASQGRGQQ